MMKPIRTHILAQKPTKDVLDILIKDEVVDEMLQGLKMCMVGKSSHKLENMVKHEIEGKGRGKLFHAPPWFLCNLFC